MRQQQQQQEHMQRIMQSRPANYLGHAYRDIRLDEDLNMTNTQSVLFVLLNFSLAVILLVAVNCNLEIECGMEMKSWLIMFSMVLALGSLIAVFGMDIDRQPRLMRKIHAGGKLVQYLTSVGCLLVGNYIAFIDGETCPKELPWLSMTMMVTLFFGWVQLIMFFMFAGGCLVWLVAKCFGHETSFTPESLWRDQ